MARDPLRKHTFLLREGDVAYLDELLRPKNIPTSTVIRKIVSAYVDNLRNRETPIESLELPHD